MRASPNRDEIVQDDISPAHSTQSPYRLLHFFPCAGYLGHPMRKRMTQVASNVYLYFKQSNGDEENQELFGELCKTLSGDGATQFSGFIPSIL